MKVDYNRTKIVATLGPSCASKDSLLAIINAGVNICRINFSHGSHENHLKSIQIIREINEEYKINIGILADLQGPKIRIGMVKEGGVLLKPGQRISFTTQEVMGDETLLYLTYENFPRDVMPGELILLDDGKLQMKIIETNRTDRVLAEVVYGGLLTSKKGVNLPNTKISTSCLTEKDLQDLHFALDHQVEWIGLSFVRSAEDIVQLKKIIQQRGSTARTIAKIEKPEAIDQIDAIIDATDAVMVARGDLGVEMPMEVVPMLQKKIVKKCILKSKPVIIATQMLESMITNPRPTRAEANDVANSVLDGADAIMLSAETSVGEYPVIVVETMAKIVKTIEEKDYPFNHLDFAPHPSALLSDAICHSATFLAKETHAAAIISMTQSGYTAFEISSYRPEARTYIFTSNRSLLNTLNLVWGVRGFFYDKMEGTDESINDVNEILKKANMVSIGDVVINTSSMPILKKGRTNMIRVSVIE